MGSRTIAFYQNWFGSKKVDYSSDINNNTCRLLDDMYFNTNQQILLIRNQKQIFSWWYFHPTSCIHHVHVWHYVEDTYYITCTCEIQWLSDHRHEWYQDNIHVSGCDG